MLMGLAAAIYGKDAPKVAVLDATLGEGVDSNASAIVADAINEQFVNSPDYRVTDRAYISSIQEEKKFQLSGDVSEADIKALGETFGADYICAPNVSILGSTYTISARLIEVATAEVIDQKSERKQGSIDVLYELAELVGGALVGIDVAAAATEAKDEPVYTPPTADTTPTYTPPASSSSSRNKGISGNDVKSHLVLSYVFPTYGGLEDYFFGYSLVEIDEYYSYYDDAYTEEFGLDFHYLEPFARFLYFSLGMTITSQSLIVEDGSYTYEYSNFMSIEPYVGFGGIIAPVSFLDLYGGISLGYLGVFLGSGSDQDGSGDFWGDYAGDGAGGVSFGIELGSDIHLGSIGLNLRYRYSAAGDISGDLIDNWAGEDYENNDFAHGGMYVGVGFYF